MRPLRLTATVLATALAVSGCAAGAGQPTSNATAGDVTIVGTPSPAAASARPTPLASPAVLPGEPWVVFRAPRADGRDGIFLARPDGSGRHQLVADLPFVQAAPAWSPDGAQIAFVERNPDEAVWIVYADGSGAHEVVPPTSGCCGQDKPDWSPDGRTIAFMRWTGPENAITTQVMLLDVATGALTVAYTATPPFQLQRARWSPDGTRLAVDVTTMAPNGVDYAGSAIGILDIATGSLETITDADHFFGYPGWSPDGTALVFESQGLTYWDDTPAGEASNLWTSKVDGSGLRQITDEPVGGQRATEPSWLSDGSICYVEAEARQSVRRFVRCLGPDFLPLPDPATPIQGTHPRFRVLP